MKKVLLFSVCLMLGLFLTVKAFAMCGFPGCGKKVHEHGKQKAEGTSQKNVFENTVYTCPMHPEVMEQKPGKCPKCGMNLESKKVCYTYECVDKSCEFMSKKPAACPVHKSQMKKTEVKRYCPHCSKEVNPDELKIKPVK